MTKPVTGYGFKGMTMSESPGYLVDPDTKRFNPRVILNADVRNQGVLSPRGGFKKLVPLVDCHSLWSDENLMLFVAQGAGGGPALHRLEGSSALEVAPISGPRLAPMFYERLGASPVYLSNGYSTGAYEPEKGTVRPWGLPLPPPPQVSLTAGNLLAGTYKLAYTYHQDGRLGGNGPLAVIGWDGGSAGIALGNFPTDAYCWITQPNGKELFLAPVGAGDQITEPYYAQPLPTLGVIPPPSLTELRAGHGRLWGVAGKTLYYSDPFQPEHFRVANTKTFPANLVLVAPFNHGLYVHSLETSWLLKGQDPGKMELEEVGKGAIPGSLIYVLVEGMGYEVSRQMSREPCPMWATSTGFVIGTQTGHLVHVTESRLRLNPMSRGAALHRVRDGWPQTIFTLYGVPRAVRQAEVGEIFDRGRLFVPAPLTVMGAGYLILSGQGELGP